MKKIILFIMGMALLTGCSFAGREKMVSRTETLMGTFVQIKVHTAFPRGVQREIDAVLGKAGGLERKFNIFDAESEVNSLNINKHIRASSELLDVIEKAVNMSIVTDGKFDITVSPILNADGFYPDMPVEIKDRIPKEFGGVGWQNISIEERTPDIFLSENTWIDLSGIAKGYIVDKISKSLKDKKVLHFLINAGGDMYCTTRSPQEESWRIGIREPSTNGFILVLGLKNTAVATSGDYENIVIEKESGTELSHIIDPEVDRAKEKKSSSITVIASTCAEADALATAMMVMDEAQAVAFADTLENVEVVAVSYAEGQRKVLFSEGAEKYILRGNRA
ncbi:MAG: FAD:protein FMN transferase [Candidatus Omnitrophota bacterium]